MTEIPTTEPTMRSHLVVVSAEFLNDSEFMAAEIVFEQLMRRIRQGIKSEGLTNVTHFGFEAYCWGEKQ